MLKSDKLLDTLINIERLIFADYTVDVSKSSPTNDTVYLIYKAAFGRAPDVAGFEFWTSSADSKGYTATDLAGFFSKSTEFINLVGENPSNGHYLAKLYNNILGRPSDLVGEAYWTDQLNNGTSKDLVLASFALSPENIKVTESFTKDGYWLL